MGGRARVHRRNVAPGRPPSWGKVVALHHLASSFDRVIWIDADAIVVDGSADLSSELRPGRHLGLVERRHDGNRLPNAGVWLLRGGRWSRSLLERVWSCSDLVDHPWWENAALLRLLGYRLFEPVRPVRATAARRRFQALDASWSSLPSDPARCPRIVHFAGASHEDRLEAMVAAAAGGPRPVTV